MPEALLASARKRYLAHNSVANVANKEAMQYAKSNGGSLKKLKCARPSPFK